MWLVLSSVVLASAIGFNILALWLSGMFREEAARKPEPEYKPTRALGPRGAVINVLLKPEQFRPLSPMPHMPLEFRRFHGS
jgi:hypothetical protein